MDERAEPIIVEETFDVSIQEVWDAISRHSQMIQWFFEDIPEFIPETGFETGFNVDTPNRSFMHLWKLTEVIPMKKIVYSWSYEELPGEGIVTFELIEHGDQTTLRLINEGLNTFPSDIPEFSRESCYGGWNYFLGGRLKEFLSR